MIQTALATLLGERNEMDAALAMADTARQTYESLGDPQGLAQAHNVLADLLRQQGETLAAEQALRETLDLYKRLGDGRGVATTQAANQLRALRAEMDERSFAEAWRHATPDAPPDWLLD